MLSIRLDPTIEEKIGAVAARMKMTRSAFLRDALLARLEDMEDYFAALDAIEETEKLQKSGKKAIYTLDEINRENGL